jgi:hypothetical protein
MPKPAWVLVVWCVLVPGSVWSQAPDEAPDNLGREASGGSDPGEIAESNHSAVPHDDGHLVDDEGSVSIQLPRLTIRGFLDVGFNATSGRDRRESSFAMGQLNLLLTSKLTDRAYFLAETYFTNPDNNSQTYMLTRANIQYSISSAFNLRIGQVHTSVGYWNQVYHHGSFVQTTVSRPEIFRYDRAYVPIHSVGVEMFGGFEGGALDVRYTLGTFNGRGRTPPAVLRVKDENDAKAVSAVVNVSPHAVDGLTVGATFYHDRIPPNPDVVTRTASIGERIIGGGVVYKSNRLELLGEVFNIYHDDHASDQAFASLGWYAQAAYVVKAVTPYYRFDALNFDGADPYFSPNVLDVHKHTLGARWDLLPWNALKVEYGFANYLDVDDEHLLSVNLSFAF